MQHVWHHRDPSNKWFAALENKSLAREGIISYQVTNLYPYVGFMVVDLTGGTADGAGYTAGFMAASYYLGKFPSGFFWGYVADGIGRKPVMIISLISAAVFPMAFGLATSFAWAITSRFLMGMMCPVQVIRGALLPEIAGSSRIVEAMGYMSAAIAVSMTIGPAVGGLLAQPTKRFPSIFPSGVFFSRFPYLLPNLVGVLFAIVCIFLTIFFVPETKIGWGIDRYFEFRQQKRTRKPGVSGDYGEVDSGESRKDTSGDLPSVWCSGKFMSPAHHRSFTSPAQPRSCVSPAHARLPVSSACEEIRMRRPDSLDAVSEPDDGPSTSTQGEPPVTPGHAPPAIVGDGGGLFKIPYVISGVLATGLMELILTSFDELYPLWAISSRRAGGVNWDTMLVGQVFFVAGIVHTVYMFSAYNWITKRAGVETTHRIAGIMAVVISAAVPFIGYFSWSGTATFIVSCVLVTLVNSTSYMRAFPACRPVGGFPKKTPQL